jgi:ABC-type sugar transport system substrate-binding protein
LKYAKVTNKIRRKKEKNMKKTIIFVCTLIMVVSVFASCSTASQPTTPASAPAVASAPVATSAPAVTNAEKPKMAFLDVANNDWTVAFDEAGKEACEKNGFEYVEFNCESDIQKQISQVQNCISMGVKGISIQTAQNAALAPILKKAVEAGITVVCIYQMEPELNMDNLVYYVIYDQFGSGKLVGQEMVNVVKTGKAGIIGGSAGHPASVARIGGFKEGIKGSGIEVVAEVAADWDRAKAQAGAEDMLTAHPDINILFACDDGMGVGAAAGIKAQGKEGKIYLGSINADPAGIDMVKSGEELCTVTVGCKWYAITSVDVVNKVLKGVNVDRSTMYTPKVVNKSNVDSINVGD